MKESLTHQQIADGILFKYGTYKLRFKGELSDVTEPIRISSIDTQLLLRRNSQSQLVCDDLQWTYQQKVGVRKRHLIAYSEEKQKKTVKLN